MDLHENFVGGQFLSYELNPNSPGGFSKQFIPGKGGAIIPPLKSNILMYFANSVFTGGKVCI